MLAPPPKPHCAFGTACGSRPGGQDQGPDICSWCKNMSFDALYKQAEAHSNTRLLKHLIDMYMHQLERDSSERIRKGWACLCACKDPEYRFSAIPRTPASAVLCAIVASYARDATAKHKSRSPRGLSNSTATDLGFHACLKTHD